MRVEDAVVPIKGDLENALDGRYKVRVLYGCIDTTDSVLRAEASAVKSANRALVVTQRIRATR